MNIHKKQFLATNFNGKMANDGFIHFGLAPAGNIRESQLNSTVYELHTEDGTHPPILVQLVDLARMKFSKIGRLPSCLTWCSHAMDARQLRQYFLDKYPGITETTECAIYFFKKQKN